MNFTRDELLWINNALNEVIGGPEAIEDSTASVSADGSRRGRPGGA